MNLFKNIRLSDALVGLVLMFAALAAIGLIDHLSGAAASGVAVAMALQSSYSARMPVAVAGMIADMTNCDVDSRICETSAGIGFGLAVGRGSADMGCVIGAAAATDFLGISVRDVTLVGSTADKYSQYDTMAVMFRGDIWCAPGAAVVDGADVTFVASTGVLSSAGTSGSQFAISGARWMDSSDSLSRVRLSGALPSA